MPRQARFGTRFRNTTLPRNGSSSVAPEQPRFHQHLRRHRALVGAPVHRGSASCGRSRAPGPAWSGCAPPAPPPRPSNALAHPDTSSKEESRMSCDNSPGSAEFTHPRLLGNPGSSTTYCGRRVLPAAIRYPRAVWWRHSHRVDDQAHAPSPVRITQQRGQHIAVEVHGHAYQLG